MKERLERRHKNVAMSDFHPPASPYRTKAGRKSVRSTPRYGITEIQVYSFWLSPFFSDSSIAS